MLQRGSRLSDLLADALRSSLSSHGWHQASNAVNRWRSRQAFWREVQRFPWVPGHLEALRPLQSPLFHESVGAYRLLIQERQDDDNWTGRTWKTLVDKTVLGDLELRSSHGQARLAGPAVVVARPRQCFDDSAVRRLLADHGAEPSARELRAAEFHLLAGKTVQVSGLRAVSSPQSASPYRSSSAMTLARPPEVRWLIVSTWAEPMLSQQLKLWPEILPQLG
jgi:hypothetical protein